MRRYIHRLKRLGFVLGLAAAVNMAGILQAARIGSVWAVVSVVFAFLFFLYANVAPLSLYPEHTKTCGKRLRQLDKGCALLLYTGLTMVVSVFWLIWLFKWQTFESVGSILRYILAVLLCLCGEGILLLNGTLRLFATSVQMGIRYRVILLLCWWIPVVDLFLFYKLYDVAKREYETELEKEELNAVRRESEICQTKYPILMVHGVFFRDIRFFNYWGRIPRELMKNGAQIYYGNQQSAASVAVCGSELAERIRQIISETGCGKLNVIAHSKGGLDMRYAISKCGAAEYVASLTTIDTPHRGCLFADYLLKKAPKSLRDFIAGKYNGALKKLGDASPDFIGAVTDLTAEKCLERNMDLPDSGQVYYRSVAAAMRGAYSARFPLNLTYRLVRHFDGENDGLVSIDSAMWGEVYRILRMKGRRGISHGDLIDLNRENIKEFDVREFYVNLVNSLKEKGL